MDKWRWFTVTAFSLTMLLPSVVRAQNTTAGTSVRYVIDQGYVYVTPGAAERRWYDFRATAGRSYCVETAPMTFELDRTDPRIEIFSNAAGTTLITQNDDASSTDEPAGVFQSRGCFVASVSAIGTFNVRNFDAASVNQTHQIRMIETTLWASWFFQGGDYNSFVLMRNTTGRAINYVLTWRNIAGVVVGTTGTLSVPAHGAVGTNSKAFVPVATINGTVEIAHNGPPGGLVGQVTSLSATTGLGFDSTMFTRPLAP